MAHMWIMVSLWSALAAVEPAVAAEPALPASPAAAYSEECGSCHLAYPARLLPRASWNVVLDGLAQHFGQNASVDAATLRLLRAHLDAGARQVRAGDRTRDGSPILRITELPWFREEHRRFDRDDAWRRASIGSAANCGACHRDADQGRFDEHAIRVPK